MDSRVFIDESGTPKLENDFYVLAACFTPMEVMESELKRVERICINYLSGAEIKSSRIGGRFQLRMKVANQISRSSSKMEVLVVDKSRLSRSSGLQYKKSMYKYCQRRLFKKIYRGIANVEVVLDTFSDEEFRVGFKNYVHKHYVPNLFSGKSIIFASPGNETLLQISDFVAGTVRRYLLGSDSQDAYLALKPVINNLEIWPRSIDDEVITAPDEKLDVLIRNHCTYSAEEFLRSNDDPVLAEVIEYLLFSEVSDHEGFVFGDVILHHLQSLGLVPSDKDKSWLQQSVIASLREQGVLIAASREGYKIPETTGDLKRFVEFVSGKTLTYLDRVAKMRDSIYYGTNLKCDMLSSSPELQSLLRPISTDGIPPG